ncbi:protein FAR-RED IMPAIRED RESPONSE 1-like [Cannabis sativa]|uniref:protein FAR-RED IMPAIRED RESPONSE 1-like n=1 Tax=Cannabis sativa TaxID=3483 RepID=UPI0029CA449A|nr:protein FAR-RED IMPAIRED RESPONSE 1-like [Cannabis sativa]
MIMAYSYFSDVVSFDTTCKKNKEGRPFSMFLEVNHHKRTTIFGAALLYDETAESFMWLFDTFANTMSGKKLKTILTDQDAATAKALAVKWPETHHRLYEEAFLQAWNEMLQKYNLEDNDWLRRMFAVKEKWALVYSKETFCAEMTTTQRLINDCRYEEPQDDFRTSQSNLSLSFLAEILKHATKIYIPTIFKLFQVELCNAYDCALHICDEKTISTKYKVTPHGKSIDYTVEYFFVDCTLVCTCKKFEFAGILCAHALKALSTKNISKIPDRYVLQRWTKHAKVGIKVNTLKSINSEDPKARLGLRYKDLCRRQTQVSTKAAEYEETYIIALNSFNKIMEDVDAFLRQKETNKIPSSSNSNVKILAYDGLTINRDEKNIKGVKFKEKVCGKSTRPKSALEKARKNKKIIQENTSPEKVPSNNTNAQSGDNISFREQNLSSSLFYMPQISSNASQIQSKSGDQNNQTSMIELMQQVHSLPTNHHVLFGDFKK